MHDLTLYVHMSSQKVELVERYGVYLTHRQLDQAEDESCNSATHQKFVAGVFYAISFGFIKLHGERNLPP